MINGSYHILRSPRKTHATKTKRDWTIGRIEASLLNKSSHFRSNHNTKVGPWKQLDAPTQRGKPRKAKVSSEERVQITLTVRYNKCYSLECTSPTPSNPEK